MEVLVEKALILKALSHSNTVVEKRTTVPVLSHVMLKAQNGEFTLYSTNIDLVLIETIKANINIEGAICVPANLLYDIVRKTPDKSVIKFGINQDKNQLILESGRSIFNINGLSSEDFPPIAETALQKHFSIASSKLRYLIDHTRFAMDQAELRHNLCGIYFHTQNCEKGKVLRAVATNMHILGTASIVIEQQDLDIEGIIISSRAITEIRKLLEEDCLVQVGFSENRVEINIDNDKQKITFSSRLVDGLFPDYEDSIKIDNQNYFQVKTKEFFDSVDRISTITSDQEKALKISIENGCKIKINPVSSQFGMAVEDVDIKQHLVSDEKIFLNVDYLLGIIRLVETDDLIFYTPAKDGQVLIRPVNQKLDETYLLMPLE
jgi:DNA polymerase III subunit beta